MRGAICAFAVIVGTAGPAHGQPASFFSLEKSIPLPRVEGRIDHMDFDAAGTRLFVAALGDNSVQVISMATSSVISRIRGLSEPQGVAFVPGQRKLYVTNGGSGDCDVFDAASLALLKRIDLGGNADNIHYDPVSHGLFLSAGESIRSISPADDSVSAGIELPGHPEGFALAAAGPLAFVAISWPGRVPTGSGSRSGSRLPRGPAPHCGSRPRKRCSSPPRTGETSRHRSLFSARVDLAIFQA